MGVLCLENWHIFCEDHFAAVQLASVVDYHLAQVLLHYLRELFECTDVSVDHLGL
jgi:hypothetical protein